MLANIWAANHVLGNKAFCWGFFLSLEESDVASGRVAVKCRHCVLSEELGQGSELLRRPRVGGHAFHGL